MNDITDALRHRIAASGLALGQDEVLFELLAAACSGCCKISNSGNGGCPPVEQQSQ
jgi:hypothetical protein